MGTRSMFSARGCARGPGSWRVLMRHLPRTRWCSPPFGGAAHRPLTGGWLPGPMRDSVGSAMARVPVRLRVTLAFAGVMAILLGAGGLVLYLGLRAELDATIDQGLRSRTAELLPAARAGEPIPAGNEEGFARVLAPGAAL